MVQVQKSAIYHMRQLIDSQAGNPDATGASLPCCILLKQHLGESKPQHASHPSSPAWVQTQYRNITTGKVHIQKLYNRNILEPKASHPH